MVIVMKILRVECFRTLTAKEMKK